MAARWSGSSSTQDRRATSACFTRRSTSTNSWPVGPAEARAARTRRMLARGRSHCEWRQSPGRDRAPRPSGRRLCADGRGSAAGGEPAQGEDAAPRSLAAPCQLTARPQLIEALRTETNYTFWSDLTTNLGGFGQWDGENVCADRCRRRRPVPLLGRLAPVLRICAAVVPRRCRGTAAVAARTAEAHAVCWQPLGWEKPGNEPALKSMLRVVILGAVGPREAARTRASRSFSCAPRGGTAAVCLRAPTHAGRGVPPLRPVRGCSREERSCTPRVACHIVLAHVRLGRADDAAAQSALLPVSACRCLRCGSHTCGRRTSAAWRTLPWSASAVPLGKSRFAPSILGPC
jgi:hypothetical protein